jgi:hypothetical protein
VFKMKWDEHGALSKHKTCLVAKGYVQWHDIEYDEFFAPVARLDSVRLLIALKSHERWEVHHVDIKSAFLNGDLQDGSLRRVASKLYHRWQGAQSAQAEEGIVWVASSVMTHYFH